MVGTVPPQPASGRERVHGLSAPVRGVLKSIRTRCGEPLTLKRVAADLDRQPEYLGWRFQQETGRTFHDRLTRVRLRRAARLIRQDVKIDAVALFVGYRGKKNFYEQFWREFGMTPGAYRERARRGEPVHRVGARPDGAGEAAGAPHTDEHTDER